MSFINQVGNALTGSTGTGNFVGATSPTITTPVIGQINDTNGNDILLLTPNASAVNYTVIENSATTLPIQIIADGSDTNIGISIYPKGTKQVKVFTTNTSNHFQINVGAGYQSTNIFNFPSASGTQNYTFPAASGTVALQTTGNWTPVDSSGAALSFTGVSAAYTVIGNMVFAYAQLTYPVTADSSISLIGGLPFTVANATYAVQGNISYCNISLAERIAANQNTTNANLYSSAGAQLINSQMSTGTIIFMITYPLT